MKLWWIHKGQKKQVNKILQDSVFLSTLLCCVKESNDKIPYHFMNLKSKCFNLL